MQATQAAQAVVATSATAPAAQVAVAAAQAALASAVHLSPQAQQAVRVEAFSQLVAQLVQQVVQQAGGGQLPASAWPAQGVAPALQALLSSLVQQATVGQALPQQLVSVQAWPQSLLQAVLQQAGQQARAGTAGAAMLASANPANPANPATGQPMPAATASAPAARAATVAIPALQNWLVLQGSIQAQDGVRGMSLTLKVPQAWALAQAALGSGVAKAGAGVAASVSAAPGGHSAAPGAAATAPSGPMGFGALLGGVQLPFAGSVQQLTSSAFGLVLQPQALPGTPQAIQAQLQLLRTSAILQLELQPLPAQAAQQAVQAAAAYTPAQLVPQEWLSLLQGRVTDPWVQMAQLQASGYAPRQQPHAGEQAGLCVIEGCQYLGRAVCAQPFCAQMNYLWSVARAQSRA